MGSNPTPSEILPLERFEFSRRSEKVNGSPRAGYTSIFMALDCDRLVLPTCPVAQRGAPRKNHTSGIRRWAESTLDVEPAGHGESAVGARRMCGLEKAWQ